MDDPGGARARRTQEEPGGAKEPERARRSREEPSEARKKSQEEPGGACGQEEPGGARSSHERGRPIKVARGGHDEPEGLEFVWLVLRKPGPIHPPPP